MNKEHIFLAIYWVLFSFFHSLFASLWFKNIMKRWMGRAFVYYRAIYSSFAIITFALVILQMLAIDSPYVFEPRLSTQVVGSLIAFIGFAGMVISLSKYVLNIYGFQRLFGPQPDSKLQESGIHAFVRHPLYLGTFLFLWGAWLVFPWQSLLITNFIVTVYTLIGIRFEEKKLEIEFGEAYLRYKERTPMIIPRLKL